MLHRLIGINHRAARRNNGTLNIQGQNSPFLSLCKIFNTVFIYNFLQTFPLKILDKQIGVIKIFK